MSSRQLDEKNALQLLKTVYELIYKENKDYKSQSIFEMIHTDWFPPELTYAFDSEGELKKKIRFSELNGYDIFDVLTSFKLALALAYMNPDFDESVMRILDDTQNATISKMLEVFMPDQILDWVDSLEESANYDDYTLVHAVDSITGNSKKLETSDDKFFYQKGIISQPEFNRLTYLEKRTYIINELYMSDAARVWYDNLNEYNADGGSFEEFYAVLKKINLQDKNLFMQQVKKNLGLL